ncbi:hypothetical protein COU78_02820 [Candidatus Peregrinibacteria bacterium CG10_big_fil_rev_8_21_14_0_10_49_24]|nr:MAG: hypothetical protein COV83_02800 [Candidatus Peregrinibacteria bacterium CG11_big_fil_rev_8_21_14_0_20_49_14]PIR51066.1 MAG: hypothetical protein COU78_02820 [Candidatus Peregrinibacteria bacterium CG10_big_fil_rev_8_21_14_0_10_49_24]PJA67619.1 MAG: hypothetical protein CO157_04300 [Candidatus Peregrinibacteria bacterium CG_4_9_14_3_um_filter_49_12]
MPLKHTTETLLVFLLAAVMVAVGIVIPTLVALPTGIVPWAVAFVLAVAYPLSLSRLFRTNRADYAFRMLHWAPAALLLLWLLLQAVTLALPAFQPVLSWYTWGWTLPGVATGFFLLGYFCIKVLRRWTQRFALLTVAFLPFMVGAVATEYYGWNTQIASVLWQGDWWQITGMSDIAMVDEPEKNLAASEDPAEESYRERLRSIEDRRARVAERLEERRQSQSSLHAEMEKIQEDASASEIAYDIGQSSSMPAKLPDAGIGWGAILLPMAGAYCAALHARTRKRALTVFA